MWQPWDRTQLPCAEDFRPPNQMPVCKGVQKGSPSGCTHVCSPHIALPSRVRFVAPLGQNQRPWVGGPDSCLDWGAETASAAHHPDWLLPGSGIDNSFRSYTSVTTGHPSTNWWPPGQPQVGLIEISILKIFFNRNKIHVTYILPS